MTQTLRSGLTIVKVSDCGIVRVARVEVGHQRGHVLSSSEHPMNHVTSEDEAWGGEKGREVTGQDPGE